MIDDRLKIARVARLSSEAAATTLKQEPKLHELLRWIRISRREPDWDADGFSQDTLRIDPVTAQLIRLLKVSSGLRRLVARLGLPNAVGSQVGTMMLRSGALLLLFHSDSSPQGCISAGRALMTTWLRLTEANFAVQPVNFALTVSDTRREVLDVFDVPGHFATMALLRVGRAPGPPPRSLRLPLDRICVREASTDG